MSSKLEIAKQYLDHLAQGDMDQVLALFADDAWVDSPIYGRQLAQDFYPILQADTQLSELELRDIFESSITQNIAIYFTYHWTLKSGKKVSFQVVDVLTFDKNHKITSLQIIYDTVITRELVKEI